MEHDEAVHLNGTSTKTGLEIESCPTFTIEQFTASTLPYEWLGEFKNSPFLQNIYREQLNKQAKELGYTGFNKMWKSYLESQNKNELSFFNSTKFTDQPVSLMCDEYVCNDFGISYTNSQKTMTMVCRHPIMPTKRLVNVDTGVVQLEISFKRGNAWRKHILDRSLLASSNKIVALSSLGVAVDSENAKELVKYLTAMEAINYDELETVNSVSRLGWINGNQFSPYTDELQYDGDLSFATMFNAVKPKGIMIDWQRTAAEARRNSLIARIMLAASFASVLVEPLNLLPFFVHIWGGTEAGKTVGLMLATSVWANPSPGEYLKTFNATSVSMELMAGFVNSMPLCIDELQIIKDRQDFDKLLYMLSEGIGRSRGSKDGGIKSTCTWKNCIITTGEMPISNGNSGGGAVNRVIEVDCKDEKLFKNPREIASQVRANYGMAGKYFVQKLNEPDGMDKANKLYHDIYAELIKGESTEKQAMAAACILTADRLADEWLFGDGNTIKVSEIAEYLTSKSDVDVNARALEWLRDHVAINAIRFDKQSSVGELWGEQGDNGYTYIIKSVFDRELRNGGYNAGAFLSWAKRCGLLLTDSDKSRCTKKKRIGGGIASCVCIRLDDGLEDFDDVNNGELPF